MNLAEMDWNEVKKKYLKDNNLDAGQPARRLSGEPPPSTASQPRPVHPSLYAMDDPGQSLPPRPSNIPFVPSRVRANGFTVPGPPPFPPPGHPADPFGPHPSQTNPPFAHAPLLPGHSTERYHGDLLPVAPPEPGQKRSKFGPMPPIVASNPMSASTLTKHISPPRLIHPTLATTPVQHVPHPVAHEPDHMESSPMDIETSPSQSPSHQLLLPSRVQNPRLFMPTPAIPGLLPNAHPTTPPMQSTPSHSKVSPVPPIVAQTPLVPLPPPLPPGPVTPFPHEHMNPSSIPMPPSLHAHPPSTPFAPGMPLPYPTLRPLSMPPFVPTPTATMPTPYTPWDGEIKEGTVPHQLINHWTGTEAAASPVPSEQLNWTTVLDKPLPPAPVNGLSYLLLQPPAGVATDVTAAYWEGGEAYFRKRLEDIDRRLAAARELQLLESMTPLQKALYLKLQQAQQAQQPMQLPAETAAPTTAEVSAKPPLPPADEAPTSSTVASDQRPANEVDLRRDFKENAKKVVKGIIRQSMFKHGDFKKFEGALREIIRSCLKDELELDNNFNYLISDQVKHRIIQSAEKFARAHKLRRRS